jgi:hypothetical protein
MRSSALSRAHCNISMLSSSVTKDQDQEYHPHLLRQMAWQQSNTASNKLEGKHIQYHSSVTYRYLEVTVSLLAAVGSAQKRYRNHRGATSTTVLALSYAPSWILRPKVAFRCGPVRYAMRVVSKPTHHTCTISSTCEHISITFDVSSRSVGPIFLTLR